MKKFIIKTLGCKVNQYESEAIAQYLKESGLMESNQDPAINGEDTQFYIVNTCTVTQKASMQSRQAVRQAIRSNPNARIIVTGCYAQTEPDEIKKIKGVHYIIGHSDKHKIPEMIISEKEKDLPYPKIICRDISNEHNFKQAPVITYGNRTRPVLKIQDGCNSFCTYCIVPYARGRSRSMPSESVLVNIKKLKEAGYREVVLSGIHLGCYGLDLSPETSLFKLLSRIHESRAINRIRLSSIEPLELTEDIIKLVAKPGSVCHHFHIPLQSGDDLILKRMHRPYTSSFFRKLVRTIHELIPDAGIGVDTLIGFPGETDEAFENTYSLIAELPVSYLHVFPFSNRQKTKASQYPDKVPSSIIKIRCQKMRELGNLKKIEFYRKMIDRKVEVLIEEKSKYSTGFLKGITSNYVPVFVSGKDDLKNTIVNVRIKKLNSDNSVFGTICR